MKTYANIGIGFGLTFRLKTAPRSRSSLSMPQACSVNISEFNLNYFVDVAALIAYSLWPYTGTGQSMRHPAPLMQNLKSCVVGWPDAS